MNLFGYRVPAQCIRKFCAKLEPVKTLPAPAGRVGAAIHRIVKFVKNPQQQASLTVRQWRQAPCGMLFQKYEPIELSVLEYQCFGLLSDNGA